jgi:hypothetical protein
MPIVLSIVDKVSINLIIQYTTRLISHVRTPLHVIIYYVVNYLL